MTNPFKWQYGSKQERGFYLCSLDQLKSLSLPSCVFKIQVVIIFFATIRSLSYDTGYIFQTKHTKSIPIICRIIVRASELILTFVSLTNRIRICTAFLPLYSNKTFLCFAFNPFAIMVTKFELCLTVIHVILINPGSCCSLDRLQTFVFPVYSNTEWSLFCLLYWTSYILWQNTQICIPIIWKIIDT